MRPGRLDPPTEARALTTDLPGPRPGLYRGRRWGLMALGLVLSLGWGVPASQATKIATYIFDTLVNGTHQQITLVVEENGGRVDVKYYNEFGDYEISHFEDRTRFLGAVYFDQDRSETGRSTYDHSTNSIVLVGSNPARYSLAKNTFDNNGSLFYLFSIFFPEPSKQNLLFLVQANLARIHDPMLRFLITQLVGPVEMSLTCVGTEQLTLANQEPVDALKYELGIHDARLTGFWPHKYYFWYAAADRKFIKYEGLNDRRQIDRVVLVDNYERLLPNPELPAF